MARRYRRRNTPGVLIGEMITTAAKLPPWGALTLGAITFIVFYLLLPVWISSLVSGQPESPGRVGVLLLLERQNWIAEWVGIACGLAGLIFAVRNSLVRNKAGRTERGAIGFLIRMFSKDIS